MGQYEPSSGKNYNKMKENMAKWLKTLSATGGKITSPSGQTNVLGNIETSGVETGKTVVKGLNDYTKQISYEVANYGGVTPETRARIMALQPGGLVQDKKGNKQAEKMMMANNMVTQLKNYVGSMPVYTPGASGQLPNISLIMKPEGMSQEDFMKYYLTNQALGGMDAQTKAETAKWLSQANPQLFAGYSGANAAPGGIAAGFNPADRAKALTNMASQLDWNKVRATLPTGAQGLGSVADANASQSMMSWLNQYLNTAAKGFSGTKAEQLAAKGQLDRLTQEAMGKGGAMSQLVSLADNLVNPIVQKQGLGLFGSNRALNFQPDAYRRGGTELRNPYAT